MGLLLNFGLAAGAILGALLMYLAIRIVWEEVFKIDDPSDTVSPPKKRLPISDS